MEWYDTRATVNGVANPFANSWVKISDHGRSPLSITVERIETSQRMANGTLRRYVVAKKRTFSCSWENLPDKATTFLANGQPGQWMEDFHNTVNGSFQMRIRQGSNVNSGGTIPAAQTYTVMITDFSKDVTKRGPAFDLVSMDMTLEEV
jgi:hypothetical protein